jgi:hypothetical protein
MAAKPDFLEQVTNYCLLGATNERLGQLLGVSTVTIDNWLADPAKSDFLGAVNEGREDADALVAKSLFHRARGYSHKAEKIIAVNQGPGEGSVVERHEYVEHYPPDTAAAALWLRNRRRHTGDWKDTRATELSGPGGGPLETTQTVVFGLPNNGREVAPDVPPGSNGPAKEGGEPR